MERLKQLYKEYTGHEAEACSSLTPAGSPRRYYRLSAGQHTAVGVVGTALGENEAFVAIAQQMRLKGLPVPEVYAVSADGMCYLQEDLGDTSLFDLIAEAHKRGGYDEADMELHCGAG